MVVRVLLFGGILKANGSGVVSPAIASDITSSYFRNLFAFDGGFFFPFDRRTKRHKFVYEWGVNGGSVNAASGGMSAQGFIRSLGAIFQLRNVGNTVTMAVHNFGILKEIQTLM